MSTSQNFFDVREQYAEFFGRAAAVYNVNPLLGRLYGYLLLSPEPMSLDELSKTAGAAKSTVSVAIRSLERYRVVRRHWMKGDRRDFFIARTDTHEMLGELFSLFFSHEIKYMRDANTAARSALESSVNLDDWPAEENRLELLARLTRVEDMLDMVSLWLDHALTSTAPAEPAQSIPIEVEE